ncbi:cytochrome d ubiquinol oxidase subunit II [candidate division KSB1 bacterium]|nr:cytochrome d ubiquinol oxidase subunit II [candidate division KSB1 bacterium]RQW01538.1 MAG: cytochrome d ubiquinol oxidase subunit II [candidate division KSB1 bacterium]
MDLNTVWFALIAVLFVGFFFLEGFDYGVGVLHPFMSKDDKKRRVTINTIGTFWDGNEVWVLTAGGAMFAAFPHWYATMFSGFYMALVLLLLALIVRGVSFEFRSKDANPKWRSLWDWMLFVGSAVPALLWGVAVANLIRGVPIDANMNYVGGFFNLLNPYALLGGLMTLSLFTYHGALFLTLKTTDDILVKAQSIAQKLWLPTTILVFAFVIAGYFATDMFTRLGANPGVVPIIAGLALLLSGWFVKIRRSGLAFTMTGITLAASVVTVFIGLFPRVLVSSLNDAWSLTIYNASSSPYTLKIMTIIAVIFVPIVLVYQGWTYWMFRKRVSVNSELEY